MIGRTLGHYRVREELSRGGMGVVYVAVDTKLDREVALKILPEKLTQDPGRRERFLREANYQSFLDQWKDGDLDRDRVAEAQRKVKSL